MPKVAAALLTIIALAVGAYLLFATTRTPAVLENATSTPIQMPVFATSTVRDQAELYTIDLQYPRFNIPAIDASIEALVSADMNELIGEAVKIDYLPNAKYELTGRFDSTYVASDVVSARLILSHYTGGAHPNSIAHGLNYDPRTGVKYSLDDALRMTGMNLQQLSVEAKKQLSEKAPDWIQFPEGADATAENYATFVIGERAVTFYFQQYQVAPYAAGILSISVPRK